MQVDNARIRKGAWNQMLIGGVSAVDIAREFGTPVYVLDSDSLRASIVNLRRVCEHECTDTIFSFAVSCNPLSEIVRTFKESGFGITVRTGFEFSLATNCGIDPRRITARPESATRDFLREIAAAGAGFVSVGGADELLPLDSVAEELDLEVSVILSAGDDAERVLELLSDSTRLKYVGLEWDSRSPALLTLAKEMGMTTRIISLEHGGIRPRGFLARILRRPFFDEFRAIFHRLRLPLPAIQVQCGEAIVDPAWMLLVTVTGKKNRGITTDGQFHSDKVIAAENVDESRTLERGNILAIPGAGAFTDSNRSHPRYPVVSVSGKSVRLVRRRETYEDMIARDIFASSDTPSNGRARNRIYFHSK